VTLFHWLLADSGFATDLISRTSSTAKVQAIVQLSLAPVFLLASIAALLNVMNTRLIWIVDRVTRLEQLEEAGAKSRELEELPALRRRQRYAHMAINLSTGAALLICSIVALLFISAFVKPALGTLVAFTWIIAMGLVFSALLLFLMETRLATTRASDLRALSREIVEKDGGEAD